MLVILNTKTETCVTLLRLIVVNKDNNALDADNNASKKGCGGHCQPTIVQCYPAPTPM